MTCRQVQKLLIVTKMEGNLNFHQYERVGRTAHGARRTNFHVWLAPPKPNEWNHVECGNPQETRSSRSAACIKAFSRPGSSARQVGLISFHLLSYLHLFRLVGACAQHRLGYTADPESCTEVNRDNLWESGSLQPALQGADMSFSMSYFTLYCNGCARGADR
ncbi:hypothetical protein BGY98DRAFT_456132 [Russula aff. rugulosa BPL654]|nr:hypothetical protein BGY98DRAFT_456132 [Russula aff. rugulosa BPL654]